MQENPCIFCKIIQGNLPAKKVLETDAILVIEDIAPKAPIHYLIMPKKHMPTLCDFVSADDITALLVTAQQLALQLPQPCAFKLVMNNGAAAGQVVHHAHLHFLSDIHMSHNDFLTFKN